MYQCGDAHCHMLVPAAGLEYIWYRRSVMVKNDKGCLYSNTETPLAPASEDWKNNIPCGQILTTNNNIRRPPSSLRMHTQIDFPYHPHHHIHSWARSRASCMLYLVEISTPHPHSVAIVFFFFAVSTQNQPKAMR